MFSIQLKNFRSLVDTGYLNLAPLTILLGRNSSGKSSFLRSLALLRQSVEERTTGPLLWYGRLVDFGGFDEAIYSDAKTQTVSFGFRILLSEANAPFAFPARRQKQRTFLGDIPIDITLDIAEDTKEGSTRVIRMVLNLADNEIELSFNRRDIVDSFRVNSLNHETLDTNLKYDQGALIPIVYLSERKPTLTSGMVPNHRVSRSQSLSNALTDAFAPFFHGNTSTETKRRVARSLGVGSSRDMLHQLQSINIGSKTWKQRTSELNDNNPLFNRIRDLTIVNSIEEILSYIDVHLRLLFRNISYVTPLRATAERYYRTRGLAVDEIDPQGKNLAMFLRGMSDVDSNRFRDWIQEHFQLTIKTQLAGGHISIRVLDTSTKTEYNLADVGFGFSQILPIVAHLWSIINDRMRHPFYRRMPRIFAIEQPELHLHPAMQAKVADLLHNALAIARDNDIDLRLVIETHSETIINRIGEHINQEHVDSSSINTIIFEKGPTGVTTVRSVEFTPDGYLKDWPYGFFQPDTEL